MLHTILIPLLLLSCHFAQSSDTPQSNFCVPVPEDVFLTIVRNLDNSHDLQAVSYTNKIFYTWMRALYIMRCNELKNYIENPAHGINPRLVTFAPNNLRVYFVETTKNLEESNTPLSCLVNISYYADQGKKEIMGEFHDKSFYKNNLAQRIKPFIIPKPQNAVYMYKHYSMGNDTAGELIRMRCDKDPEKAYLYFQLYDALLPSGWLADHLPKLHDAILNTGTARYVPWHECDNQGPLKKIRQRYTLEKHPSNSNGIVIFDIHSFIEISDNDRATLFRECQNFQDDIASFIHMLKRGVMHMHFSWGHKGAVAKKLQKIPYPPKKYKISGYGRFACDVFTEQISFKPKGLKKSSITVKEGDTACTHAFDYLEMQQTFVKKDWSVHADSLFKKFKDFANTRYIFEHNKQQLLVKDTVTNSIYLIHICNNKQPTIRSVSSVMLNSCHLTRDGCDYDIQPEDDTAKE